MDRMELMELRSRVERAEYVVDTDRVADAIVRRILDRAYRSDAVLVAGQAPERAYEADAA